MWKEAKCAGTFFLVFSWAVWDAVHMTSINVEIELWECYPAKRNIFNFFSSGGEKRQEKGKKTLFSICLVISCVCLGSILLLMVDNS